MRSITAASMLGVAIAAAPCAIAQEEDEQVADRAYVVLTTNKGEIALELNREKAPVSVENFLQYVNDGFYDGTIFHRVMPNFMIQGGGFDAQLAKKPTRDGIENEWRNGLSNMRGTISMARVGGSPNSGTCQFFINVVDNNRLDQPQSDGAAYAVFGKVIGSMDAVEWIRKGRTRAQGQQFPTVPVETKIIESAEQIVDGERIQSLLDTARQWDEAREMAKSDQFAAAMKSLELRGFDTSAGTESESGLWSLDLVEGDGVLPSGPTETVHAHYTGWLVTGEMFDSSVANGQPLTRRLDGLISGWTEGLASMSVGGKRMLVIPPDLNYGSRGAPGSVPPNSHLIFEIELLRIGQ